MFLEKVANIAEILTALVAAFAYARYVRDQYIKRRRLEAYLKSEKATNPDRQRHTILHLIAALGMTEEEILRSSFGSKLIRRTTRPDAQGLADQILLGYKE